MADIYEIQPTDCIGNSRAQINTNFNNLNLDIEDLQEIATNLQSAVIALSSLEEATTKYVNDESFYKESDFVYGFSNIVRPSTLANKWADVYTNTARDPLKIQIQIDEGPKAVLIQGRVNIRHVASNTSTWIRLARFDTMSTDVSPIEVLDLGSSEGTVSMTMATQVDVSQVYVLQPGIPYIFGVQTFFWLDTAAASYKSLLAQGGPLKNNSITKEKKLFVLKKKSVKNFKKKRTVYGTESLSIPQMWSVIAAQNSEYSSVIINGWGADDSIIDQYENTVNPFDLTNVRANNKYTDDDSGGANRIGKDTKFGYVYDEQAKSMGVENYSFIRATVL